MGKNPRISFGEERLSPQGESGRLGAASAHRDVERSRGERSPVLCSLLTQQFDVTPYAPGAGSIIMLRTETRKRMALFLRVAELAEQMAATASRLKKRAAIAQAIAAIHAAAPSHRRCRPLRPLPRRQPFAEADPRKLNAGGALLSKAVLAVSGATGAALTAAYRRHGDLGAAAFDLLDQGLSSAQRSGGIPAPFPSTLAEVAEAFAAMAIARTTAARAALVENLLRRATPLEAKYLLKLMLGDMRIGVKQSLVEEAIAEAASRPTHPSSRTGPPRRHARSRPGRRRPPRLRRNPRRSPYAPLPSPRLHARLARRLPRRSHRPLHRHSSGAPSFAVLSRRVGCRPSTRRRSRSANASTPSSKTSMTACAPNSIAAIQPSPVASPSTRATAKTSPKASLNSPKPSPTSIPRPTAP